MKIGQLAKYSGLSVHTLRYYEKCGLLSPQSRGENNYRSYDEDALHSARFIKRCKANGFSLEETAALLKIKDAKSEHVCAEAKTIALDKVAQIQEKIEELQKMQNTIKELASFCCGGSESAEFCSIISALEDPLESKSANKVEES